ncbi:MAG: ribokinase RbsK [Rhodobacteraceae bacterium HLUCCA12]|nr:MAG: ribokinase RbsK [Rhodobacteraceae bacterium HLUCCA12]
MTVFNLGSINIDHYYRVPNLPQAGETVAAQAHVKGLGGKGANQSVAALRAGARVVHIGAIGKGDAWTAGRLAVLGLDMGAIARVDEPTGHAVVATDAQGENAIVIHPGANRTQVLSIIEQTLNSGQAGDVLLLQNETSHQVEAAKLAREHGMKVFYSAAPFELAPLTAIMPHVTHLLVNAVEAAALKAETGAELADLPVQAVIVTRGAEGADWIDANGVLHRPAFSVKAVDTTGAGDCFAGSLAAAVDQGMAPEHAMRFAAAAAALKVTRAGTAEAMPENHEVDAFLASQ